jgi:hypothetical protein
MLVFMSAWPPITRFMTRALAVPIVLIAGAPLCWTQPYPLSGFADEGAFVVFKDGESSGTLTFEWKADGTFENNQQGKEDGRAVRVSLSITPDKEGRWETVVITGPHGQLKLKRDGKEVNVKLTEVSARHEGESLVLSPRESTSHFTMRDNVLAFDSHSPALISQALRRYDRAKGGKQEFPCRPFTTPAGTDVVLEVGKPLITRAGGRGLLLTTWKYNLGTMEFSVPADNDGRVYLAEVPAQQLVWVREGYEELRKAHGQ